MRRWDKRAALAALVSVAALGPVTGRAVAKPWLGVQLGDVSSALRDSLALTDAPGAVVTRVVSVIPGSKAAAAGLRAGDVIAAVNGHAVDDPSALCAHLNPIDARATLTIWRGAQRPEVEVALAPRPRGPAGDWMRGHDSLMYAQVRRGDPLRDTAYVREVEQPSDPEWEGKLETVLLADPEDARPAFGNPDPVPAPGSREDLRRQVEDLRREVADLRRRLARQRP